MNRTKSAIIDAFWLLLEEKPYNKITVKDIVERCHMNRNTFYYHFHDIPELLEITIKNDADQIIQDYGRCGAPLESILCFIEHCNNRKKAILHIYRSVYREYFINELDRIGLYIVNQYLNTVITDYALPEEDKALLTRFYKCMFTGVLIDWLNQGMQYDLTRYAVRINTLFHGAAERAYQISVQSAPAQHPHPHMLQDLHD